MYLVQLRHFCANRLLIRVFLLGFAILYCVPCSHDCVAGTGIEFKLPQRKKRVKNGIIADVNYRWIDGVGCRPIRITLTLRKTNRDRTLRVDVLPNSGNSYAEPLRVSSQIEIPAGKREVTKTIYVQQDYYYSNTIRLEFFEEGRYLDDLSMKYSEYWNSNYYNNGEKPCVLFVDADAPSMYDNRKDVMDKLRKEATKTKKPSRKLPRLETLQFMSIASVRHNSLAQDMDLDDSNLFRDIDSLRMIDDASNFELLRPMDVPESYVGLNSVDLMVFSYEDLASLLKESPTRFTAIDEFVRNGGNLVVYGADADSISDLFVQAHGWKKMVADEGHASRLTYSTNLTDLDDDEKTPNERRRKLLKELQAMPDTFIASHGIGRIVASTAEDPYLLKPSYWTLIESELGISERLSWVARHGVSYNSNNGDFWDFLIPGYGATPVVSFLTVIALFVLCIGPLNFVVLKRTKRFYLLPFTVALAAIVTTTAMMVYALLSDGVTQRARLRSFTSLEEKTDGTHVAATHCRHSYLAAVAPLKGLVFPERTMVFAVSPQYKQNPRAAQRVTRNGQKEYYRGYIGSRSTSQVLTTGVSETEQRIATTRDEDGGIKTAKNDIGVSIKYAWLIDAKGNISYAENCESGAMLDLKSIDRVEARKAYRKMMSDNRPEPPKGLDKTSVMGGGWRLAAGTGFDSALLASEMSDTGDDLFKQSPNTYIIVTEQAPPFLKKGLPDAVEEAGFHLIRGKWAP